MGDKSAIQWTDATWNPTTGCDRVSPGCANCYALTSAPRLKSMAMSRAYNKPTDPYMRDGDPKTSGVGFGLMMHEDRLDVPLRWTRPRRIFVNSMSDLFHPEVTDDFIDKVFAVMALAPQHIFQILTKRPERMREYMEWDNHGDEYDYEDRFARVRDEVDERLGRPNMFTDGGKPFSKWLASQTARLREWPLPNVWLGTSVENARWRTRIDELRETPAAVRFLSCEPLLGPLVLPPSEPVPSEDDASAVAAWVDAHEGHGDAGFDLTGIDWVIVGGESGPNARPMKEVWVRDIVAASRRQGAAPFVKQTGTVWAVEHGYGRTHGGDWSQWPEDLRVREYPTVRDTEQMALAL